MPRPGCSGTQGWGNLKMTTDILNARDEFDRTSLHMAAKDDDNPDGKAKTAGGQIARGLAQNNEALHGTEAMQLLNEARSC